MAVEVMLVVVLVRTVAGECSAPFVARQRRASHVPIGEPLAPAELNRMRSAWL